MQYLKREALQSIKNFSALAIVQLTNYLLPLVTLPYLIRVLGLAKFGQVSLAQALLLYVIIITDYGFNFSTTREISVNREDPKIIGKIVSTTIVSKTILLTLSFLILIGLLLFVPKLKGSVSLYVLGFVNVIGQTYFPMWFFQGIEKLRYITILNFISRLVLTILIFIVIKTESDFIYVLPIYGFGSILASLIGLFIIFLKFKISFQLPTRENILENLWNGKALFVSTLANNSYINAPLLILGALGNELVIGIYSVADKVLVIFRQVIVVFAQSIYPSLCRFREKDETKVIALIKGTFVPFFFIVLIGAISLLIFPQIFSIVLTGSNVPEINFLIMILSSVPIILLTGTTFNQILFAYEFKKQSMVVYLSGTLVAFVISYFLIRNLDLEGAALGAVFSEIYVLVALSFTLKKNGFLEKLHKLNRL